MGSKLDREAIERVVAAIADRLEGDWVLVGGGLVALWLEPRRVTEDIDVVSRVGGSVPRLQLMELAHELGLPIEAVNSAADFFLYRIVGWENQLEVLRRGTKGRILRPTPTLFVLLKVDRLSESDLGDCLAMVEKAQREGLVLDAPRVLTRLDALGASSDPELEARRRSLRGAIVQTPAG